MNFGHIIIVLTFLSSLAAAIEFFRKSSGAGSKLPVRLFNVSVGGIAVSAVLMFYLLFSHQFQYTYVAQYSSATQSLLYLISAFWAGQEGTFLLWALLVGIMGLVFLKKSNPVDYCAMGIISAFISFLALIMIVKSPFNVTATTPADGAGMNPLLQNFWMVIHPPILFIGYAATIFPFALIISALKRRNYDRWNASGFQWSLFATTMLGAGIIIGGFWAYEVLGWGGYWGWDPVENSSLVPWLTLLALIHGLLVQKMKGSLARMNMVLGILSFILVLYATFLTRSGVLQDFSVHSFEDLGISNYLIAIMVIAVVTGFGFFITRFREIHSPKIDFSGMNRELTLLLGLCALCAGALFTFFGMSSPILTGLWGKASQVDISFYNKVNLPVAIVTALLLGITPFLGWKEEQQASLLKRLSLPLILTILACIIAYVGGVTTPSLILFVGSASFALISNSIIAFRQYRSGWWNLGGPISHIGVGLLLLGIVGSGSFDETTRLVLQQNQPQSAFGYSFTFQGIEGEHEMKPLILLGVSDGKNSFVALPRLYYSEYNKAVMREPDIKIFPLKDLYISPIEMDALDTPTSHNPVLELTKGETKKFGDYDITFARFDVGQHAQTTTMSVGAVLEISHNGKKEEIVPVLSFTEKGEKKSIPVEVAGDSQLNGGIAHLGIALTELNVEEKKVHLEIIGTPGQPQPENRSQLILEVSTKPLMMVVWTGVLLIIAGSAMAFRRRLYKVEGNLTSQT